MTSSQRIPDGVRLVGAHLRHRPLDAVFFLSVFLVLAFGLQAALVISVLGAAGYPAQLVGVAGFVWWLIYQVQKTHATDRGRRPVRMALFGLATTFSLSYVVAMTRPIAGEEVSTAQLGMITLVSWLGVALLAADGLPDWERFDTLLGRLVLAAGLLALLGIAQFATGQPLLRGLDIPGLSQNVPAGGIDTRSGFTRPPGTAIHPIEFGAVLTIMLPLAITRARTLSRRGRHLTWFWVGCMGLGVVVSISRSALVCALVGLTVLAVAWSPAARVKLAAALFVFVGFVAATIPGLLGGLRGLFVTAGEDPSVASRTGSYGIAAEFFERAPFLGRGYSTFLPRYRIFDNQYLLLLVEVGLVGLLAFLTVLVTAMVTARRTRKHSPDPEVRELGQAFAAAVAAGAVGLALYDGLSFPLATYVLFLVVGLCGAFARLGRKSPKLG